MTAPSFVDDLLAWRTLEKKTVNRLGRPYAPNCADVDNCDIADYIYAGRKVARIKPSGQNMGTDLEELVLEDLIPRVRRLDPRRSWDGARKRKVSDFTQYSHLKVLDRRMKEDLVLRTEFGREYTIKPDITIGSGTSSELFLHAVISVKWSMRNDRVQNVRPEGALLSRHRRGRPPHFVVVTTEPLPTRIAAIAMTTGEVDSVYHVMFDEMEEAVKEVGSKEQRARWKELVTQGRVRDYNTLPEVLTTT
ncbi:NgoMIV family type II restriction endonuclease [Actinoplanes sichuanensis]|uniref:NgoMIV family type II restriction endonuclease n=1 Tax=Actinoplanes sichuanensis TaxID=512349 RepID=A0ABW4A4I8_9ACTN|nr:NgoMIV family type II restriction endonuclease [Actinoplanes sichuanensis]